MNGEKISLEDIAFCLISIPWDQDTPILEWVHAMSKKLMENINYTDNRAKSDLFFCPCSIDWNGNEDIELTLSKVDELQREISNDSKINFTKDIIRNTIFCNWNMNLCLKAPFAQRSGPIKLFNLVEKLNMNLLVQKIQKENNLYTLAFFLRTITWANEIFCKELWKKIDNIIIKKIQDSDDIENINRLLWIISLIPEVSIKKYNDKFNEDINEFINKSGWIK